MYDDYMNKFKPAQERSRRRDRAFVNKRCREYDQKLKNIDEHVVRERILEELKHDVYTGLSKSTRTKKSRNQSPAIPP
jgi:hypothetical protein